MITFIVVYITCIEVYISQKRLFSLIYWLVLTWLLRNIKNSVHKVPSQHSSIRTIQGGATGESNSWPFLVCCPPPPDFPAVLGAFMWALVKSRSLFSLFKCEYQLASESAAGFLLLTLFSDSSVFSKDKDTKEEKWFAFIFLRTVIIRKEKCEGPKNKHQVELNSLKDK